MPNKKADMVNYDGTAHETVGLILSTTANDMFLRTTSFIRFDAGGSTERMRIDTGGSIILQQGNDIRPNTNTTSAINIANAAGTDFVTFDTINNRIGLGTVSPSIDFDVENSLTSTGMDINNTAVDGDPRIAFQLSGTNVFTMGVDDSDGDSFKIGTTAIETNTRMMIDSSGNIGVGVSPTVNEGRVQVFANGDQTNENTAAMLIGDRAINGMRIFFTVQNTDNWCGISSVESGVAYRPLVFQYNGGNVKVGGAANRATTDGTALLTLFNGTAPVGSLTSGISLYSAAGELNVMDAGGVATLLSPHDKQTGEWIFRSKNSITGKVLLIRVEKLLRLLNRFSSIFGYDFITECNEVV